MKKIIILIFLIPALNCWSQTEEEADKASIKYTITQFFKSLEDQDTVLYKSVLHLEGQVWALNKRKESSSHSMRFFGDDVNKFDPKIRYQEKALSFEIKIHNGLAMAWVPYEFSINGVFSHCGVDIFTLMKTDNNWKILSVAYSTETEGCEDLRRKN